MNIAVESLVEHRNDRALGQGKVLVVQTIAGVPQYWVQWSNGSGGPSQHSNADLLPVRSLVESIADAGPASRVPFQLKVLGRWFEARHSLTGELSNQPFQMLPHQVVITNRVISSAADNRAWLVADDVGLGKTIEAGMIMEVLRKKTLGRFRCLVVAPAGLVPQWIDELANRFGRRFRRFESHTPNALEADDLLVASIDTLKAAKFEQAFTQTPPWDLVIFDEAHHLATTPSVLAYKFAQRFRAEKKARNLLFLTATPHSGKDEHFFNMLRLLREDLFPKGGGDYEGVSLKQVMLRNRKSDVTDAKGEKIFKGIGRANIISFEPNLAEVAFHEELREYLRSGYKAAERLQRKNDGQTASAVGFLMSTFAKLASSSRAAIRTALENRLVLLTEGAIVEAPPNAEPDDRFAGEVAASVAIGAGIEPAAPRGKKRKKKEDLIDGEVALVKQLLARLERLEGPDTKLESFLKQVDEELPKEKLLIFTEYRATQAALVDVLAKRFGEDSVTTINGSMNMAQRQKHVSDFNEKAPNPRFMISTEAGGEGLNMQKACHILVNYDLPWNPMALQQRIGRVYRYGQKRAVVVFNLMVKSDSEAFADQRVYQYLERKIEDITKKLSEVQDGSPDDVRGEVLGQIAMKVPLDELYKTAVEEGQKKAEQAVDQKTSAITEILNDPKGTLGIFKGLGRFDLTDYEKVAARVGVEQLDFFVRRYLASQGTVPGPGANGTMSFDVPRPLADVSSALSRNDPYQVYEVAAGKVKDATVDKERARQTSGSTLLLFGHPAFDAMVRHVQHGHFGGGNGTASLELPAEALNWDGGTEGTWALFDLAVARNDGSAGGLRILKNELASFLVPRGGPPARNDAVVEVLDRADDGPLPVDLAEVKRAFQQARAAAEVRLGEMYTEVGRELGGGVSLVMQEVQNVALAWVSARRAS